MKDEQTWVADEAQNSDSVVIDGGISLSPDSQLQRGLKSRHIQFLALGGA
jgi:amino acid transporter